MRKSIQQTEKRLSSFDRNEDDELDFSKLDTEQISGVLDESFGDTSVINKNRKLNQNRKLLDLKPRNK